MTTPTLRRRLWLALLTGVPFGVFKLGTGGFLWLHVHPVPGAILATWGVLDILLNLLAVPLHRWISYCFLSNVGRLIDRYEAREQVWEPFLLAVDTLCAFAIVATMIWFGLLGKVPGPLLTMWNVAVVCNVLAVGLEVVWVTRPRSHQQQAQVGEG